MEESKEPTDPGDEEVEGHTLVDRPPADDRDTQLEEADVEAHCSSSTLPSTRPSSTLGRELFRWSSGRLRPP